MAVELAQLLTTLRDLKRIEKLYVIQFLVAELAKEETPYRHNSTYPVWSPHDAFDTADGLLKALAEEKGRKRA